MNFPWRVNEGIMYAKGCLRLRTSSKRGIQSAPDSRGFNRLKATMTRMTLYRSLSITGLLAVVFSVLPLSANAYVEYGAFYATPAPHSQLYYQPMYAYAATPVLNDYQHNSYGYGSPQYSYDTHPGYYAENYYLPQYQTYSHSYPQYNYAYPQAYNPIPPAPYGQGANMYGQPVPYSYGYPTGETVPWTGGQLCEFPDYDGRALCGSNPNQWIYDPWTGTWY
jgi:hypothetical protein